jgi:hypothetical protein
MLKSLHSLLDGAAGVGLSGAVESVHRLAFRTPLMNLKFPHRTAFGRHGSGQLGEALKLFA